MHPWRWRIGVFIGSFIVAWIPYWIPNLLHLHRLTAPWWRVPVVTPGVFDSYLYLHWIGAAAAGLSYGGHMGWYASVTTLFLRGMESWASLPEVWIATRWLALAMLLFIGAWGVQVWSGLDAKRSRFLIGAFWLTTAVSIGLRPGAYSWYLPFAFVGLTSVICAYRALERSRVVAAIVWSIVALITTIIYPWNFMFAGLWMASMVGARLIRWSPRWLYVSAAIIVGLVGAISVPLARWFVDPSQAGFLGVYERTGIVFARVPFFANTVLALAAWIALLGVVAFALRDRPDTRERITLNAWAWIVLFLLWFNTPITGIHLYSDHFIAPTIVLAWLSFSAVWASMPQVVAETNVPRVLRCILIAIAFCSSAFVIYIVVQSLRLYPTKFDSIVVHILHWFILAVTSWLCVIRLVVRREWRDRPLIFVLFTGCAIIGGWGLGSVITRDMGKLERAEMRIPVINWIRSHVAATDRLCADLESASFYAAHTGRVIIPAEATLTYAVPSSEILDRLETFAGAYDIASSGNLDLYQYYTSNYRTLPCASGAYSHNAFWGRLLRRFGADDASVNTLIGCRQDIIDTNWKRISSAIHRYALDEPAFRRLCPQVIIPDAQRPYWQLPKDYQELRVGEGVGIWSVK